MTYMGSGKNRARLQCYGRGQGRALKPASGTLPLTLAPGAFASTRSAPGPIKTLAASAVSSLKDIFSIMWKERAAAPQCVSWMWAAQPVFLASDLSCAVTGEIIYVGQRFQP